MWCVLNNYSSTNIDKTTKYFHQLSQNYNIGVVDNINGRKYDNRLEKIYVYAHNVRTHEIED